MLLLTTLLSSTDTYSQDGNSSFTIGLKYGTHKSSFAGIDDGRGTGVISGFNSKASYSAELEYLSASLNTSVFGQAFVTGIQSLAAYYSYRSNAAVYGVFEIGLLVEYVDNAVVALSDQGLSIGLGGGYG